MRPDAHEHLHDLTRQLGLEVPPTACALVTRFLAAMLAENEHLNLTAIRDSAIALVAHALDSLALAHWRGTARATIDLGTGNGFPAIAVRALHPEATSVWIERTQKKAAALARCLATAAVEGVRVVALDAAQVPARHPELRASADLITARALAGSRAVAALADPLLAPGGSLVLWLDAGAEAPSRIAGNICRSTEHRYQLPPPFARMRRLVCYGRGSG